MKYIRTKNGRVFEIIESDDETGTFVITNHKETYTLSYYNENIYKEADTIEKLCDEFVWDEDLCYINFKNKTLELKGDDYTFDLVYCLKKHDIYGAIWLKLPNGAPRLEPVAKLNEEGELELL